MEVFAAVIFFVGLLFIFALGAGLSWLLDTFINWFTSGE